MKTALLALLLAACTGKPAVPNLGDPTCAYLELDVYTAENTCIRLSDKNGLTVFRRLDDESCGGDACLMLQPGETGVVLAEPQLGPEPEWLVLVDECPDLPACQ